MNVLPSQISSTELGDDDLIDLMVASDRLCVDAVFEDSCRMLKERFGCGATFYKLLDIHEEAMFQDSSNQQQLFHLLACLFLDHFRMVLRCEEFSFIPFPILMRLLEIMIDGGKAVSSLNILCRWNSHYDKLVSELEALQFLLAAGPQVMWEGWRLEPSKANQQSFLAQSDHRLKLLIRSLSTETLEVAACGQVLFKMVQTEHAGIYQVTLGRETLCISGSWDLVELVLEMVGYLDSKVLISVSHGTASLGEGIACDSGELTVRCPSACVYVDIVDVTCD